MSVNPQSDWYRLVRRLGRGPNLRPLDPEEAWADYENAPDEPAPVPVRAGSSTDFRPGAQSNTELLLDRARACDEAAWRELYRRYRTMLVIQVQARIPGFARRRFDAEDVLQEVFAKAWSGLDAFEYRGEGSFRRWLATLVVNTFRSAMRSQAHEGRLLSSDDSRLDLQKLAEASTSERDRVSQDRASVLEHMGSLGEEDCDILTMRHFEEMSFDAIARVLGVSREAARTLYQRALGRLQRRLGGSKDQG